MGQRVEIRGWAANTVCEATARGVPAHLESWPETCHVPYSAHRQQIPHQTTSFLWWTLELWNAPAQTVVAAAPATRP